MTSPQAPEDGQGGGDPPRDLRSVLVTSVLNLEQLDGDLFRGRHYWVPTTKRLFGGQIMGQALVAAAKSVSEDVHVHSLHCYFVRAGDPKVPVLYHVERTRTGASFSVRSVKAVQHGRPIFTCQASFQLVQPSPIQHQFCMPAVPPPEELLDYETLIDQYLRDPNLQAKYRVGLNRIAAQDVPIEIKPVTLPTLSQLQNAEPKRMFWVRARGYIGEGDFKMHCCVAAYISDYAFLGTALLPYQGHCKVHLMASLDHSMWFHAPFRADHWMLYECESPWAGSSGKGDAQPHLTRRLWGPSELHCVQGEPAAPVIDTKRDQGWQRRIGGSRGLVRGQLWRRDGVLAVSCAQEGVIRVKPQVSGSKL